MQTNASYDKYILLIFIVYMAPRAGIEPAAYRLGGGCSIR